MIWTRGELVADEALRVSVLDRTFEHGLGLFETFADLEWSRDTARSAPRTASAVGRRRSSLRLDPSDEPESRGGWSPARCQRNRSGDRYPPSDHAVGRSGVRANLGDALDDGESAAAGSAG